jgi:cardiolipin synthase
MSEAKPTDSLERAPAAPRLTARRLLGLDRSGPPPPETVAGAPLRPWTIPNAIVVARFALIPVFLVVAYSSGDGTTVAGAVLYCCIALTDYADGIAARVTRQYSRLGTLLDPLVDRLLVLSGLVVCWSYETLPRWALALVALREASMLVLARWGLRHGLDLKINWPGRIGIWFVLGAPCWAMLDLRTVGAIFLYVALVLVWISTAMYVRDGLAQLRDRKAAPTPSSSA